MDVYAVLRAYILADPELAAVLGTRVYPIKLPQAVTCPAMTIQRITGETFPPLHGRASLARPRYQCDVWTKEGQGAAASEAQRIGRLLLDRLEGAVITVEDGEVPPPAPRIVAFEFDSDRDFFDEDVSGGYYRYSADYFIVHQTGHGT